MALIREVRGHTPVIGENTFLAETAVILGDVTIGRDCSIWYNAVLRGDVNKIVIGDRTNIQDGAVLHTIYDKAKHPSQTIIGNDVSVGHNAVVHGARIGDNCLIGMGAILLDNAVKYAPAGAPVRLTLRESGRDAALEVENPGDPIPPEQLAHLFDRFYRADASRSDHEGFGLGLSIAQSIVTAHRGTIRCRSDAQGTCFTVTLPLQK